MKQCLLEENHKASDLTNLYQVDLCIVVSKENDLMPKESSPHIDSHPPKKNKKISFGNTMSDEPSKSVHCDMIHNDLIYKLDESPKSQSTKQGIKFTYSIGEQ